ncbi:hypothetical protein Tco_0980582, partial [Tanacetum coccineum]
TVVGFDKAASLICVISHFEVGYSGEACERPLLQRSLTLLAVREGDSGGGVSSRQGDGIRVGEAYDS